MKKEFNVKGFNVRSFMVNGLTAKWGIGSPRDESYKKPLHAWTIKGRVDGSTDFTPLPDIMGTANALTLTGFDGTAGSGFENGYLMFDGVDGRVKTAPFTIEKDWTLVGEWEFMSDKLNSAGLIKSNSFFIYNNRGPGRIAAHINTNADVMTVQETGFNATCSDGRIYGKTWKEYLNDKPQTTTSSNGSLIIGGDGGTKFTTMKFRNIAIYDRVLNEEQCKKAYDWLQTQ